MRQTTEFIMKSFRNSGKKHLILTGSKGCGKSTFVSEIEEKLSNEQFIPGITTYLVDGKCVMLRENGTSLECEIGRFECGMKPVEEGFSILGIAALERAGKQKSEWILLDEIGFLESKHMDFQNAVRKVFEEKRVFAVVRKQDLPFLNELRGREDAYVVDVDELHKKVGCVIMASGISARFGSNKLLADFKGKPLVQYILDVTEELFTKRVVVTRSKEVEELCKQQHVDVIYHELQDRNEVVRQGVSFMKDMDGCIFCPCDQPLIHRKSLQKMKNAFSFENQKILRLAYEENIGTPILFAKQYFDELCNLPKKKGGAYVARNHEDEVTLIFAESEGELYDIDTYDDLKRLEKMS